MKHSEYGLLSAQTENERNINDRFRFLRNQKTSISNDTEKGRSLV